MSNDDVDVNGNSGPSTKTIMVGVGAVMLVLALLCLAIAGILLVIPEDDGGTKETAVASSFTSGSDRVTIEASIASSEVFVRIPKGAEVVSATMNVKGDLHNPVNYFFVGKAPTASRVADLDDDGDVDIVTVNYDHDSFTVLMNRGDGRAFNSANYSVSKDPIRIVLGDFDGDGTEDVATISETDTLDIYFNFQGSGVFVDHMTLETGVKPTDITAADLNNDGYDEVVALSRNEGARYRVWWNDAGTFTEYTDVLTENSPIRVLAGDIDQDGNMDLVVANRGQQGMFLNEKPHYHSISKFLLSPLSPGEKILDGELLIRDRVDYPLGMKPSGMEMTDLNDDGYPDIFTSGYGSSIEVKGNINVLLNDGTGSYPGKTTGLQDGIIQEVAGSDIYPVHKPDAVTFGDLDGDGDLEVISTSRSSDSVEVLVNQGNGSFKVNPQEFVGFGPVDVQCADFDNDGSMDLITTDGRPYNNSAYGLGSVSIIFNYGYAVFKWDEEFKVGSTPRGIDSSDVDNDGDLDIASANYFGSTMSVIVNDGTGNFGANRDYQIGLEPYAVCMADFDQDGWIDIASADEARFVIIPKFNRGDGTFTTDHPYHYDIGGYPFALRTTDLNNDNYPDLITANHGQGTLTLLINQGPGAARDAMFGNDEEANKFVTISLDGRMPFDLAMGDVDGDGFDDLITANMGSDGEPQSSMSVLLYDQATETYPTIDDYDVGKGPSTIVLDDYDGDGDLDTACVNSKSDSLSILFNDGTGKFFGRKDYGLGARPFFLATADIDGDNDVDLLATCAYSNTLTVLLNDGFGEFTKLHERTIGAYPYQITVGDFNHDGVPDIGETNVNAGSVTVSDSLYYPHDVSVYVPSPGGQKHEFAGEFDDRERQVDLADQINAYLKLHEDDAGDYIDVPIIVRSDVTGLVTLSDLAVEYTVESA